MSDRLDRLVPMRDNLRVLLVSFLVLFLELALIRWTGAHVVHLGYFANLALLGCFLGIGAGLLLARSERLHLIDAFPWILAGTVGLILLFEVQVVVDSSSEIHFTALRSAGIRLPLEVLVPTVFLLIAAAHAGPAQELGRFLRQGPPLRAYSWNILGSLLGIAAFFLCSLLGLGAPVWFSVIAVLYLFVARPGRNFLQMVLFVPVVLCAVNDVDATWSPYYRIQTWEVQDPTAHGPLHRLEVNRVVHQFIGDIRDREPFYAFPYDALGRTPENVLIIGAGTGTDAAVGLARGAGHVDAVEIDPGILQLGHDLNPHQPYRDPRVTTHATDGRVFMKNCGRKYDLVLFGLPDSLGLVSNLASVRLESFLFTLESLREARRLLEDDGLFVMYNYYRQDWLVRRLAEMLLAVYGEPPVVLVHPKYNMTAVLFAGPAAARIDPALGAEWGFIRADPSQLRHGVVLPTDDWPFLYLRNPGIPSHYLAALAAILALTGVALLAAATARRRAEPHPAAAEPRGQPWHLFFTGAAFMLLETSSVVRASLLLGSTWTTNAFVFFAILVLVLLANAVVLRFRLRRVWPWAALLAGGLAAAGLVPLDAVLGLPPWLRIVGTAALMLSPVFFANVLFARFFQEEEGRADLGLAVNLLGTMVGGVLEYASMALGYRFLVVLAAGLYVAAVGSWVLHHRAASRTRPS